MNILPINLIVGHERTGKTKLLKQLSAGCFVDKFGVVSLMSNNKPHVIGIEHPLIDRHPSQQVEHIENLINVVIEDGLKIAIETHSDYIVDTVCDIVNKKNLGNNFAQIIYCRTKHKPRVIKVDNYGLMVNPPVHYRKWFKQFHLRILGYE